MRRAVSSILLYIGIVLLILSIYSYALTYQNDYIHYVPSSKLLSMINEITPENTSFMLAGQGYLQYDNTSIINTWYYITGCRYEGGSPRIYLDVIKRKNINETKILILVHDYGSSHVSLFNLATYLASKGYTVYLPDLPGHGNSRYKNLSLTSLDPEKSFWIQSLCTLHLIITHVEQEYHPEEIGIIGISTGGTLAYTAGKIFSLNFTISIGFIGDYNYSISRGSLTNFLFKNPIVPRIYDPVYIEPSTNTKKIIIIGTNDEYFYINSVARLLHDKNTIVLIKPNTDRRNLVLKWKSMIINVLGLVEKYGNSDPSKTLLEDQNKIDTILWRPIIPGLGWYCVKNEQYSINTYVQFVSSQILVAKEISPDLYMISEYKSLISPITLTISIILVIAGLLFMDIRKIKELGILDALYLLSLVLIVFLPLIPTIYAPNRFNISYLEVADRFYGSLPIISHLIIISIYIGPLLLLKLLFKSGRTSFFVYVSTPIFNAVMVTSFYVIMGFKFNNVFPVFPTWSIIIPIIILILDYAFAYEETHPS